MYTKKVRLQVWGMNMSTRRSESIQCKDPCAVAVIHQHLDATYVSSALFLVIKYLNNKQQNDHNQ